MLQHSWPLSEQAKHFDLGCVCNAAITDAIEPPLAGAIGNHHAGLWECDLANNKLIWSGGVYDLFGLPRGAEVTREQAVALYSEASRAAMERLRAYAIRHACGFTMDVEILPAVGQRRRIRLIGAPVCDGETILRLHGLKLAI